MSGIPETDRLILRRFMITDVDALTELDSDPEVMHFVTGGRPTPRAEIADRMLPYWMSLDERGDGYGFRAAIDRATGDFLGWFHLRPQPGEEHRGVELGYRLRRAVWGHGYASEGSRALIGHGFADLGADRIYAQTMVVHTASRRVMEKAGLRLVRTFPVDWPYPIPGDEEGDVEYALTRAEWEVATWRSRRSGR